jgi:hypothetical protein
MRLLPLTAILFVSGCAAPQPTQAPGPPRELAGRVAGSAQRCVLIQANEALRVSDTNRHVLLYGSGKTIWANQLAPGCGFGRDDVLITEPVGSYYCRGDLVRSMDRLSHIPGPACVMGEFVPYTRG